jgi:hypothetical protein
MGAPPLRVDKIVDILKAVPTRSPSRSIHAAGMMGNPVGRYIHHARAKVQAVFLSRTPVPNNRALQHHDPRLQLTARGGGTYDHEIS